MVFRDLEHRDLYNKILGKMKSKDAGHRATAYLLAFDNVLHFHVNEVFDFEKDWFIPESMDEVFQTSSSRRTMRLAMNLWGGYCGEEEIVDEYGNKVCVASAAYSPYYLFDSSYSYYYCQAILMAVNSDGEIIMKCN